MELYKINDFELEKGNSFPDYGGCLFYVMRGYNDFPETIIQSVNRLIDHAVKKYEQEHQRHLESSECELSVWLDIDRHTKDMCLNFLILNDKSAIEIEGIERIKPDDELYLECKGIFMQRLEEFLFTA